METFHCKSSWYYWPYQGNSVLPCFSSGLKFEPLNKNATSSKQQQRYYCCYYYHCCCHYSTCAVLVFLLSDSGPALFHIPLRVRAVCTGGLRRPLRLWGRNGYWGQPWSWKQTGKGKCITATIQCQATEKSSRFKTTSREAWGSSHIRGVRTPSYENHTHHSTCCHLESCAFCLHIRITALCFLVLFFRIIQQLVNGIIAPTAMPNIGVGPW